MIAMTFAGFCFLIAFILFLLLALGVSTTKVRLDYVAHACFVLGAGLILLKVNIG